MSSTSMEPRTFVDFEPRTEWLKGKESDTIMINVSGFKKEQLKVLINTAGCLKISGERPIEGRHWSRFLHSFSIPKNCNLREIQAKFDGDEGLLYVILPLLAPLHLPSPSPSPFTSQVQDSAAGTSIIRQEVVAPHAKNEALKSKGKMVSGEEEEEDNDGKRNADFNYEQESRIQSERKHSSFASLLLNKRKLLILSVILGVMVSLGLAVYLSYRLRGL